VVYQDLVRVNKAIEEKELDKNEVLLDAFAYAKKNNKSVHYMGLVSDGGVHSHIDHLKGLITIASNNGIRNLFVHAFTDGRDTDPKGGYAYIKDLVDHMSKTTGALASIVGRYYAMDRDKRWERVKLAYDVLVKGTGEKTSTPLASIQKSYDNNVTDEFIKPVVVVNANNQPIGVINEGDVVLCFNFRTDRGREITEVLTQKNFPEHDMKKLSLYYITLTNYDDSFQNVKTIFDKDNLDKTLGEVVSAENKKQIRIAETEKYPHVTFFFFRRQRTTFSGRVANTLPFS
jgi:2,3-bisphosphoglycerate-independent phosphoglycerate mutase